MALARAEAEEANLAKAAIDRRAEADAEQRAFVEKAKAAGFGSHAAFAAAKRSDEEVVRLDEAVRDYHVRLGLARERVKNAEALAAHARDFVATRLTPGVPPDRFIVLRNLDIPDGGSLPSTIDFNSASSVPATAAATIQNPAGDDLEIFTELVTARSGRSLFWFDLAPSTNAARVWAGLPSDQDRASG